MKYTKCKKCKTEWAVDSIGHGRTWSTDGETIAKCILCFSPGFSSATVNVPPMDKTNAPEWHDTRFGCEKRTPPPKVN